MVFGANQRSRFSISTENSASHFYVLDPAFPYRLLEHTNLNDTQKISYILLPGGRLLDNVEKDMLLGLLVDLVSANNGI